MDATPTLSTSHHLQSNHKCQETGGCVITVDILGCILIVLDGTHEFLFFIFYFIYLFFFFIIILRGYFVVDFIQSYSSIILKNFRFVEIG